MSQENGSLDRDAQKKEIMKENDFFKMFALAQKYGYLLDAEVQKRLGELYNEDWERKHPGVSQNDFVDPW